MSGPRVIINKKVIDAIKTHSFEEAKEYGHEVFGWLLGFFLKDEVYVLKAVKCTNYLKQSRVEAEADPAEEAELASRYPRNIGIVGLYHSHPFRSDYRSADQKRFADEQMFHSDVDGTTLKSRASRKDNYLSVVTDGRSVAFFYLDKGTKEVREVKPMMVKSIVYSDFLTCFEAKVNVTFEKELKARTIPDVVRNLEEYLLDYVTRNIEGSEMEMETVDEKRWNVKIYALDEDGAKENVIRIQKNGGSYIAQVGLNMWFEVYLPDDGRLVETLRNEIVDDVIYLIRKSFDARSVGKRDIGKLELHLGNFRLEKNELPEKHYLLPDRRMIIKK